MLRKSKNCSWSLKSSSSSGNAVTLLGGSFWVLGVGITDGGIDSLPEYIEGTGCNFHRNVAYLPTFKNFFSKCLEQTQERRVGAQPLLFTNLIHFLFIYGFFKGKRNTGNFLGITLAGN